MRGKKGLRNVYVRSAIAWSPSAVAAGSAAERPSDSDVVGVENSQDEKFQSFDYVDHDSIVGQPRHLTR